MISIAWNNILDYCTDVEELLSSCNHSADAYMTNKSLQYSLAFCILQIGELTGSLSPELRLATKKEMDWAGLKGMRNIVVHNYGSVKQEYLWETATKDIPVLKAFCRKMLSDEPAVS